jgi:hypothetical protein
VDTGGHDAFQSGEGGTLSRREEDVGRFDIA